MILAVSIIEHIGLDAPQVDRSTLPVVSGDGDLEAFREMYRMLKPSGEIVMTLPFGLRDELILSNEARKYTVDTIRKFETVAENVLLECYE